MAQFKKTYPLTKSTLTINYPDGLLSVIDKPKDYFRRTDWDSEGFGDSYYPDVIVVPENGSFINSKMTFKRKVSVYMNDNGSETLLSNEPETTEQCIEPFGGEEVFWHPNCRQIKGLCQIMLCFTPISVLNHAEWQLQQDKADGGGWYLRHQYTITINITGKPKFFKSNANRYFCYGQSENDKNGKAKFAMAHSKKPIGWVGVSDKAGDWATYIDIKLVNLGKFVKMECENRKFVYSKMETKTLGTSGQNRFIPKSSTNLSAEANEKEKTHCDGCFYEMGLVNSLPTGSGTYQIKDKYVTIGNDQIVAVQLYPPGKSKGYIEFEGKISEQENPDAEGLPKITVKNTNDTFKLPVDFPYIKYYLKNGEKIFHIRSSNYIQMLTKMKLTNNAGLAFKKYFVTNSFTQLNMQFFFNLIRKDLPYFEWGLNLFPVFVTPKVSYLKLNCTHAADPKNVLGNEDTWVHGCITRAIEDFGIFKEEKNVDSYPRGDQTVKEELRNLKNSKSKFKILYVNCHGGKYSDSDASYGALDDPPNRDTVVFDYKTLKYLLNGRTRNDEYYFVHFSSCFGGGFCENLIHNNVTSNNYAVTTASSQLGNNLLIWYNDNANSPAWVGPHVLGDLFNLIPEGEVGAGDTYSNQAAKINRLVAQSRQQNVQLVLNFMRSNLQTLVNMFKPSVCNWTQQTYQDSINYASNMLIWASRRSGKGADVVMKYPIIYVHVNMIRAICENANGGIHAIPIKPDITFTEFTTNEKYFLPIINNFFNANRSLIKQTEYMYLQPQFYNMIRSNAMKTKLKRYLLMFKNLYVMCCQMDVNTQELQKMNRSYNYRNDDGEKHGYDLPWMLDDTPGVIDRCGSDYGSKKWPYCPGVDENNKMDETDLDIMVFHRGL